MFVSFFAKMMWPFLHPNVRLATPLEKRSRNCLDFSASIASPVRLYSVSGITCIYIKYAQLNTIVFVYHSLNNSKINSKNRKKLQ